MKRTIKPNLSYPILTIALLLSACGGGGGGGGGNSGFEAPAISTTPVSISEANETEVAQAGVDASTGSSSLATSVPFSPLSLGANGSSKTVSNNVYQIIQRAVIDNVQSNAGSSGSVVGVQISGSDPCLVSGSESYSGNVTDTSGNSISSGDYVTVTYSDCNDGFGEVLNGSLTITFNSNISDTTTINNFDFSLTAQFSNYQSTQEGYGTVTIDGALNVSMTASASMFTFRMSGESLYAIEPGNSTHLTNFDISFSYNDSTLESVIDSTFTIASTALNGQITVDTYFVFPSGSYYPASGSLTITGSNSQLAVDVVGDGTVNVTLTIGGSVQAGYPKNVTWAELGVEINNVIF